MDAARLAIIEEHALYLTAKAWGTPDFSPSYRRLAQAIIHALLTLEQDIDTIVDQIHQHPEPPPTSPTPPTDAP